MPGHGRSLCAEVVSTQRQHPDEQGSRQRDDEDHRPHDSNEIREVVEADFMQTEWAKRTFAHDQPANVVSVNPGERLLQTRVMRGA